MKKIKIILFTLLLSIIGVVGSTNAASVNNSSRSADLMPSAASQLIQNSSLSETNIENSESGKCILWSPRIRNFKKGDQVKVLLPHGKYTGKTLSVRIVSHGKEIATLTLEYGSDYGVITFTVNANSGEIAPIIAGFGSMDFGAIGAGGVIDIGDCAGNGTSKKSIAPVVGYSSSLSNRNDDNIRDSSLNVRSSSIKSSSLDADGKVIIINPGPGPVIIPSSKSSTSMSSLSTSSENESVHRCSSYSSSGVSKNQSKRTSAIMCSSSALSSLSVKSSKLKIPKESSRKNAPIRSKKQTTKRAVRQASQPMVDQNGNLHLNPQQVRTLKHEMHFSNSKAAKAVKKMNKAAALHGASHESVKASNPSKQGLTLKHRNAAHPVSNVRRVTLPIQGILPATRMDPYTWVYSLVGLAIMIVSGRAFFSKKRK